MNRIFTLGFFLHALCCLNAQAPGNWLFTGYLTGDQEVPALMNDGKGYFTLLVDKNLATAQINGVFTGLSGDIANCHLHSAPEGSNGGVVLNLKSFLVGNKLQGTINLTGDMLARLNAGLIYINVHTAANPSGEIRAQLNGKQDPYFASFLTGFSSVPPVATLASGVAVLKYDLFKDAIEYHVQLTNLSGPVTGAHIHDGDETMNGPVILPLSGSGNTLHGEFKLSDYPLDFIFKLFFGAVYINVHTAANPGGEIRGQIGFGGSFFCHSILNGDQENPPVTTTAQGLSIVLSNATLDTFTYVVIHDGLSGATTGAHVHLAEAGKNGPVISPLSPSQLPNLFIGGFVLDRTALANLSNGLFYANLHTAANPGGEIRGQITTSLRKSFAFDLCGAQSVPSKSSNGYGVCGISINQGNTNLIYELMQDGIPSAVNAAHIHNGAKGSNGGVLLPLVAPDKYSEDILSITGTEAILIEGGNTYVNVHSADFPAGEIRGQVDRTVGCIISFVSDVTDLSEFQLSPNPARDQILLDFGLFIDEKVNISILNLDGRTISTTQYSGGSKYNVSLDNLTDGIYTVDVKKSTTGKSIATKKFVVQH